MSLRSVDAPGDDPVAAGAPGPSGDPAAAVGAVVLRLGGSRYAVDMADVAEVAPLPRVTRVPRTPTWLLGVANWRGRVLPVLDLRPLFATSLVPLASSARLVVVSRDDLVVPGDLLGYAWSLGGLVLAAVGVAAPWPRLTTVPAAAGR